MKKAKVKIKKVMNKNKVAAIFKKGKESIRKNEKSNTRST